MRPDPWSFAVSLVAAMVPGSLTEEECDDASKVETSDATAQDLQHFKYTRLHVGGEYQVL